MRLVRDERQHDEIGIVAVEAVPQVGGVPRPALLPPDVIHDLVLPFARHIMPCTGMGASNKAALCIPYFGELILGIYVIQTLSRPGPHTLPGA